MVAPMTYRGKDHNDHVELSDVAVAGNLKLNPTPDMAGVYPAILPPSVAAAIPVMTPFSLLHPTPPRRMSLMTATKLLAAGYLTASALAILSPFLFVAGLVLFVMTAFVCCTILLFGRSKTPAA